MRRGRNVVVAALEDEHQPLLAGLEVLHLPDHLLDVGTGLLGFQPGLLGVVQLGIPCILAVQVTQRLMAAEVSLLALLEVVFGILLSALLTGERPGQATLWGGTAVLAALVYNEWTSATPRGAATSRASRS